MTTTIQQQMTDLIVRTDPTLDDAPTPTTAAAPSSPFSMVRLLVVSEWAAAAPDPATLATMTNALDHFLAALLEAGITDLDDADGDAHSFVEAAPTPSAWHLRKNTLVAAYSALLTVGAWHTHPPVHGLRPGAHLEEHLATTTARSHTAKTPRNRVATSDEVLLTRICARLDGRAELHRRAAALAIACAGATPAEGPRTLWEHDVPARPDKPATLHLSGRHHQDSDNGWYSAPRTVTLDRWSATALADWRAEASRTGRPPAPGHSIVYLGTKPLTDPSPKICFHALINGALAVADLNWQPGLTPLAIAEWAAAHAALRHGLDAGAHVMGVDQGNCHRRLMKAATRAYRAS